MLVLARRIGESILIAPDIEVTFLSVKNGVCRLGITAPRETKILRKELCDKPPLTTIPTVIVRKRHDAYL